MINYKTFLYKFLKLTNFKKISSNINAKEYSFIIDLTSSNINFDLSLFLIIFSIKSKNKKTNIIVLPNKKFSNLRIKEKNELLQNINIRLQNILIPLINNIENFKPNIFIMHEWNEIYKFQNHKLFPNIDKEKQEFVIKTNVYSYKLLSKYHSKFNLNVNKIKGQESYLKIVNNFFKNNNINLNKVITITLRNSSSQTERNSNEKDFVRFADFLDKNGYIPIILDDYEKIISSQSNIPIKYKLYNECVHDLNLRIALYESSLLNIFTNGGPVTIANLSKNINFMFFKIATEGKNYPTNIKFIEEFLGLKKNEKFNFLNKKQIFIWEEDNYENLIKNFEKHIGNFEESA